MTIAGFPCSGKTKRTTQLKSAFESRISSSDYSGPKLKVTVINDESVNVPRTVYDGVSSTLHGDRRK